MMLAARRIDHVRDRCAVPGSEELGDERVSIAAGAKGRTWRSPRVSTTNRLIAPPLSIRHSMIVALP